MKSSKESSLVRATSEKVTPQKPQDAPDGEKANASLDEVEVSADLGKIFSKSKPTKEASSHSSQNESTCPWKQIDEGQG